MTRNDIESENQKLKNNLRHCHLFLSTLADLNGGSFTVNYSACKAMEMPKAITFKHDKELETITVTTKKESNGST